MNFAGKTSIKSAKFITEHLKWITANMINGELLQLNNNASTHQRHLQYLALDVFKPLMHLNPGLQKPNSV